MAIEATGVQRLGLELLTRLVRTLRVVGLHQVHNDAAEAALANLWSVLGPALLAGEPIRLRLMEELVYLGADPLRLDMEAHESAVILRRIFGRLQIDQIAFAPTTTLDALRAFLIAFQQAQASDAPHELGRSWVGPVRLQALKRGGDLELDVRQLLVRHYARLVLFVEQDGGRRPVPPERFRRVLQSIADAVDGHESLLVGLTRALRPAADTQFHHRAATAVLSLLLARKLKLSRALQLEIALAGLHHEAPGPASRHPTVSSVLRLLEPPASEAAYARVVALCESRLDLAGLPGHGPPGVIGRLLAVTCAFDRLSFPGAGSPGLHPDRALRSILEQSGQRFDPRVVRLFVSLVGVFPIGSLVRLSDGRLAVVVAVSPDPALAARPTVRVVDSPSQVGGHHLDLSVAGPELLISSGADPVEHAVNPPQFLLG